MEAWLALGVGAVLASQIGFYVYSYNNRRYPRSRIVRRSTRHEHRPSPNFVPLLPNNPTFENNYNLQQNQNEQLQQHHTRLKNQPILTSKTQISPPFEFPMNQLASTPAITSKLPPPRKLLSFSNSTSSDKGKPSEETEVANDPLSRKRLIIYNPGEYSPIWKSSSKKRKIESNLEVPSTLKRPTEDETEEEPPEKKNKTKEFPNPSPPETTNQPTTTTNQPSYTTLRSKYIPKIISPINKDVHQNQNEAQKFNETNRKDKHPENEKADNKHVTDLVLSVAPTRENKELSLSFSQSGQSKVKSTPNTKRAGLPLKSQKFDILYPMRAQGDNSEIQQKVLQALDKVSRPYENVESSKKEKKTVRFQLDDTAESTSQSGSQPTFQFGNSNENLTSTQNSVTEPPKQSTLGSGFSFGATNTNFNLNQNQSNDKPSNENLTSTQNSITEPPKQSTSVPTFSFGAPQTQTQNQSNGFPSFGNPTLTTEPPKQPTSTPTFSFGNTTSTPNPITELPKQPTSGPTFSFGAANQNPQNQTQTQTQIQNQNQNQNQNQTQNQSNGFPSFGNATLISDASKQPSTFAFGNTTSTQTQVNGNPSAFQFGKPTSAPEPQKQSTSGPSFSFGPTNQNQNQNQINGSSNPSPSISTFQFGAPATTQSTFTFGAANQSLTNGNSKFKF